MQLAERKPQPRATQNMDLKEEPWVLITFGKLMRAAL
jgi:hypothetical protein